ncbi:MAG: 2-amino-4-ketopentanoate thiolase [Clostridiaceae bacterium]|nr:2-amino-4-ketopentanoate thiolase [Clostridiaceae bacterium]
MDLDPGQYAERKKGDYVVVQRIVLTEGERAPQVPEDTAKVPLIALFKGYLEDESAVPGDEVNVITMSGRKDKAVLTARDPSAQHTYGRFVPELMQVHRQVRDLVFGGE